MVCEKQFLTWNVEIFEVGVWWSVEVVKSEMLAFRVASLYANQLGEHRVRIVGPDSKEI